MALRDADVRVRLSAEGVADVIAAFHRIRSEADKTARQSGGAFGNLLQSVGGLKGALSTLGVSLGVEGLRRIVTGASDSAEKLLNLKTTLASSVNELVAFDHAAKLSGSSLDSLARPLAQFGQLTNEALAGGRGEQLFRALRLTGDEIKKFAGASTVQRFAVVSEALDRLERTGESTGVMAQVLGRKIIELDPVFAQFAQKGIAGLAKEVEQLGLTIDEVLLARVASLGDDFDVLGEQAESLGKQFTGGFAEVAAGAFKGLQVQIGASGDAMKAFGRAVGLIVGGIVALVGVTIDALYTLSIAAITAATTVATVAKDLLTGLGLDRARADFQAGLDTIVASGKAFGDRLDRVGKAWATQFSNNTRDLGKKDVVGLTQLYSERLALIRSKLDREIKAIKAANDAREQSEQRSFDRGLEDVRTYYDNRRRIAVDGINAEIAALLKARTAVAAKIAQENARKPITLIPSHGAIEVQPSHGPSVRRGGAAGLSQDQQKEIERINSEIERLALERTAATMKITDDEFKQVQSLQEQRLDLDRKVFEARGQHVAAALIDSQKEIDAADELLFKLGETEAESRQTLDAIRQTNLAQIEWMSLQSDASAAFSDLNAKRQQIEERMDAGLVSRIKGERELIALDRERLPLLRQIAEAMTKVADESENPGLIEQARAFQASVEALDISIQATEDSAARLGVAFENAAQQGLEEFFTTGITQAIHFGDAIRSMTLAVLQNLQQIIGKLLAARIAALLFGALSPSNPGGGGGITGEVSGAVLAAGTAPGIGRGSGPGSGGAPGGHEAIMSLNRGDMSLSPSTLAYALPRPAEAGDGEGPGSAGRDGSVTVGLEDGLVARKIEGGAGQRAVLRVLQKNAKAARQALGLS